MNIPRPDGQLLSPTAPPAGRRHVWTDLPRLLPFFRPAGWLLVGALILLKPRPARAEDSVSFKYEDYRESGGRIGVQVRSALVEKDLGPAMQLKLTGVIDTIAGATPNGQPPATPGAPVPLSTLKEERQAWTAEFSRQFSRVRLAAGLAQSRESDYLSTGWSLNSFTDFNQKNTQLLLGGAITDDDVRVFFRQPWVKKRTLDLIAGVTQALDPNTSVALNFTYSQASGYLSDPYKLVQKNVELFPGVFLRRTFSENRPDARDRWIVLAAVNRTLPKLNAAVDASYRLHHDTFGVTSHTFNLEWYQKLGGKLILRPSVRWYAQSAADFYHVTLDGTLIIPTSVPTGKGPYYSADYRLSKMHTLTYGLKLVWTPGWRWQFDAALEKYEMRGSDAVTSATAYPQATIFTTGLRFVF